MATKFETELGHIEWPSLIVYQCSSAALKVRTDYVLKHGKPKCARMPTKRDNKMHLHRLECGQSIAIPYSDNFNYKDALKFRVRYYSEKSYCYYIVVRHKDLNLFEIARIF